MQSIFTFKIPNRINYTINRVEAIVEARSRRTEHKIEAEQAATRKQLSEIRKELSEIKNMLRCLVEKADA